MILSSRFFDELDVSRSVWIGGDLGGGKTLLAFDMASFYWRLGYNVCSNVPHNFGLSRGIYGLDGLSTLRKSFAIADEAGEYIREQKLASSLTRSMSKADYYMVFSGRRSPHKLLCDFQLSKAFDFSLNYGVPLLLWFASFQPQGGKQALPFPVWQWRPSGLYGLFSTLAPSSGLDDLLRLANATVLSLANETNSLAGESQSGAYDDAPS